MDVHKAQFSLQHQLRIFTTRNYRAFTQLGMARLCVRFILLFGKARAYPLMFTCGVFGTFFSFVGLATETPATKHVIGYYALTSANDFPERDPQDWRLLGSNDDGKNWSVLDAQTNQVFEKRWQRKIYKINNVTAYNTYRLQIIKVRDSTGASVAQLAELELMSLSESDHSPT